jgi:hypothetical protein
MIRTVTTLRLACRSVLISVLLAACASAPKPVSPAASSSPPPASTRAADPCGNAKPVHPKVSPQLEPACFGTIGQHDGDRLLVRVILAKDADPTRAKSAADAAASSTSRLMDDRGIGGSAQLVIAVASADQVQTLSQVDGVAWIEPVYQIKVD